MSFIDTYTDIAIALAPSRLYILVGSALLSSVMACFLLAIYFGALRQVSWLRWLSVALFADALEAVIRASFDHSGWSFYGRTILWLGIACSVYRVVVNVFGEFDKVKNKIILSVFWLSLLVVAVEMFFVDKSWHRIALSLLAMVVTGVIAWQLVVLNAYWFRHAWKKVILFFIVLFGWLLFLLACFNPFIALYLNGFPLFGDEVDPHSFPLLSNLNLLLYSLLAFFKVLCFLVVVLVAVRMLRGQFSEPKALNDVILENTDGFDGKYRAGVLGYIGQAMGVDFVEMTLRMDDGRLLWYGWFGKALREKLEENDWNFLKKWYADRSPSSGATFDPDFYKKVMEPGDPIVINFDQGALSKIYKRDTEIVFGSCVKNDFGYVPFIPGLNTFIAIPVIYQGAVIGTLGVESMTQLPLSSFFQQKLQTFARSLAIPLENIREMRALNDFVDQMERALTSTKSLKELVSTVVQEIKGFLGVKGVGFEVVLGCARRFAFSKGHDVQHRSLVFTSEHGVVDMDAFAEFLETVEGLTRYENALELKYHDGGVIKTHLIGSLHLAQDQKQKIEQVVLVRSQLFRKSISDYLANLVLRIVRIDFQNRIQNYWDALSKITCTPYVWFDEVERLFVGHCGLYAEGGFLPAPMAKSGGVEVDFLNLTDFVLKDQGTGFKVMASGHLQVLIVDLPHGGKLFICNRVSQGDISFRLQGSPWRQFLEDAHRMTSAYFVRLNQQELQKSLLTAERDAIRGVVQNLGIHELKNVAARLNLMAYQAMEECSSEQLPILENMYQESKKFSKIANELNKPLDTEDKDAYLLSELFEPIKRYLDFPLAKYGIEFSMIKDVKIEGIQYTVLHLVIMNLVNNAIEALKRHPTRKITIDSVSDRLIRVTDSGPGVPASLRERLFQPGVSTSKEHSGVGLAGCRQLLRAHHGELFHDLKYTQGARFCIELKTKEGAVCREI